MSFPTEPNQASAAPLDPQTAARNRLVIGLLLISTFTVFLNETIMSVALPRLMEDLQVSAGAVQWLTTAFLLTMAVVIPVTGFLLQRMNTRPVFILAMVLFSIGTLISALSPGLPMLIVGRIVQASGTAVMMPLMMTTVMTLVPPESRGKTMGNISIVMSVAPAIGPTIGGFILDTLDWRWMFWLVLPIALGALALGYVRMKNVSEPRYAPLDYLSVVLSAIAFGGIVYGLSQLGEHGGGAAVPAWVPLAVGLVTLAVFIARQLRLQREDKALLDLRTFTQKIFTVSIMMMAVMMMALFGAIILLPIYMQNVLGMTTLQSGLLTLPGGLLMGFVAPFIGRLYDRYGPTPLLVPGSIVVSAVMWFLTTLTTDTSVAVLLAAHIALCGGLALMFTPLFTSALGSLPPQLYSHGSATIGTIQQVAGAAGVALFIALMTMQSGTMMAHGATQVAAVAGGIRLAFMVGATLSLFAIIAAFFIRKPEPPAFGGEGEPAFAGH